MTGKIGALASEVYETRSYEGYVNPRWAALLNPLGVNVDYERCGG